MCLVNDIPNTQAYTDTEKLGGNYEVYLGRTGPSSRQVSSWSLALIKSGILFIKDVYWDRRGSKKTAAAAGLYFAPPWKTANNVLGVPRFDTWREDLPTWKNFIEALRKTSKLAIDHGAQKVIFALMPGSIEIYQDHIKPEGHHKQKYLEDSREQVRKISQKLSAKNVTVIDMTSPLREAAKTNTVSVDGDFDYHLNHFGVQTVHRELVRVFPQLN